MRELVCMARGHEKAEWWRLSHFMAFIANRLRFSKDDPVTNPDDLNPFAKPRKQAVASVGSKIAAYHAAHPNMPLRRMKQQPDGSWAELKDEPKPIRNALDADVPEVVIHGK